MPHLQDPNAEYFTVKHPSKDGKWSILEKLSDGTRNIFGEYDNRDDAHRAVADYTTMSNSIRYSDRIKQESVQHEAFEKSSKLQSSSEEVNARLEHERRMSERRKELYRQRDLMNKHQQHKEKRFGES